MFRVIIAGGRKFENYKLLKFKMDRILSGVKDDIFIISGGASGADKLGEKYAKEKGYKLKVYPAKWDDLSSPTAVIKKNDSGYEFNSRAGYDRNVLMAENADALCAFWDKFSPGTKSMINIAKQKGLPVRIITY